MVNKNTPSQLEEKNDPVVTPPIDEIDFTQLDEQTIDKIRAKLQEASIHKLYEHLEQYREQYHALIHKLSQPLLPFGLTAEKYLSVSSLKALHLLKMQGKIIEKRKEQARIKMFRTPKNPNKYQNPHDPNQKWTGIGVQPRWVKAHLKEGGCLEDLLIQNSPEFKA